MSSLLDALNHLIATALGGQAGAGPVTVRSLVLEPEGGRLIARIDHPSWKGELVVKLSADPPQDNRQMLHLRVERWPEKLPPALAPFRALLEKARLHLELDLSPP